MLSLINSKNYNLDYMNVYGLFSENNIVTVEIKKNNKITEIKRRIKYSKYSGDLYFIFDNYKWYYSMFE